MHWQEIYPNGQSYLHSNRYPSLLSGHIHGIRSLSDTFTHEQQWESNTRPLDFESVALTTWPRVVRSLSLYIYANGRNYKYMTFKAHYCSELATDLNVYPQWSPVTKAAFIWWRHGGLAALITISLVGEAVSLYMLQSADRLGALFRQ